MIHFDVVGHVLGPKLEKLINCRVIPCDYCLVPYLGMNALALRVLFADSVQPLNAQSVISSVMRLAQRGMWIDGVHLMVS